jgi:site-specific DNA-methyltransferase (adenine-specific)
MPIKEICDKNSVLFLWATSPKLEQAFSIIREWGFEYKTSFVWDKVKHNFGYYNSIRHEFLLIAGKGSSTPDSKKLHDSVISIERSKVHSEKPEFFRDLIDELYTWGNRIELFHRGKEIKKGWDSWGNE